MIVIIVTTNLHCTLARCLAWVIYYSERNEILASQTRKLKQSGNRRGVETWG